MICENICFRNTKMLSANDAKLTFALLTSGRRTKRVQNTVEDEAPTAAINLGTCNLFPFPMRVLTLNPRFFWIECIFYSRKK